MEYKYYNDLYVEFNRFIAEKKLDFLDNDSLLVVSLQDTDRMFVIRKIVKDDAEGFAVLFGVESMYTLYLLENAVSQEEQTALLAGTSYCLLLKQKTDKIIYNIRMFNSAAGIPEEEDRQFFCGYMGKCSEPTFPDETYSLMLTKILSLLNSATFDESLIKRGFSSDAGVIQVWDRAAWEKIVKKGLDGQLSLAFKLDEKDRLFLAQLEPKLKLTNLVFEVDYNLIKVADKKNNEPHSEILVSVLSAKENKCLYLEDVKDDSDVATDVVKSVISSIVSYKYPYRIICKKNSVYMWLKHICDSLNIEIEMAETLVATDALYERLKGEKDVKLSDGDNDGNLL